MSKTVTLAMWDDIRQALNVLAGYDQTKPTSPEHKEGIRLTIIDVGHRHGWTPEQLQTSGIIEPPPDPTPKAGTRMRGGNSHK